MTNYMFENFYDLYSLKKDLLRKLYELCRKSSGIEASKYKKLFNLVNSKHLEFGILILVAELIGLDLDYYKSIVPSIRNRTVELLSLAEDMDFDLYLNQDDLDCYLSVYLLNIGLAIKKNHDAGKISVDFSNVEKSILDWIWDVGSELYSKFERAGIKNLGIKTSKLTYNDVELVNYDGDPKNREQWKKYIFLVYKLRDWIYHYKYTRVKDGKTLKSYNYLLDFSIECDVDNPSFIGESKKVDFRLDVEDILFFNNISFSFQKQFYSFISLIMADKIDEAKALLPKTPGDCKYLWQIYALKTNHRKGRIFDYYCNVKRLFGIDLLMTSSLISLGLTEDDISYKDYYASSIYTYADYVYIHDSKNIFDDIDFAGLKMGELEVITPSDNLKEKINLLFNYINKGCNVLFNSNSGYNNGKNLNFNVIKVFDKNGYLSFNGILTRIGSIKKQIIGTDMRNSNGHMNSKLESVDGEIKIRHRDTVDQTNGIYDKEYMLPIDDYFSVIDTYASIQIEDSTIFFYIDEYINELIKIANLIPEKKEQYLGIVEKYKNALLMPLIDGKSSYDILFNMILDSLVKQGTYNGEILSDGLIEKLKEYLLENKKYLSIITLSNILDGNIENMDFNLLISERNFDLIARRELKKY